MAASNVATGQARAVLRKVFATKIHERESGIRRATLLKNFILGSVEKLGESGQDHRYGFGRRMSSGPSISPWSGAMADSRKSREMPGPSQPNQVLDAELKAWAEGEGDDQRELLVEARVPQRTVSLGNSPSGRILPRVVETAKNVDRNSLLEELQCDLDELLGTTTNLRSDP